MRMKRFFVVAVVLLLSFALIGCSNNQSTGGSTNSNIKVVSKVKGTVRVAVAGWQLDNGIDPVTGNNVEGVNDFLKKEFQPRFPNINLKITQIPWENAKAKQTAMLKSGDVDVLYTGGAYAFNWYQDGYLADLNQFIEKDQHFDPNIYLQGLWKNAYSTRSPDGKVQFGIPFALGRRVIGYDKKLFKQWGVKPLPNNPTPEEILADAKKMTGKNPVTGEQNYGLYFEGNSLNDSTVVALTYAFGAKGAEGSLGDMKNVKWELNTPQMAKVMNWLKEAAKLAPPAFVNGKGAEKWGTDKNDIGIYLDASGSTVMSNYEQNHDKSYLNRWGSSMNMGPNGLGWVAVDPIIMAKNAKNKDASWQVVKFLSGYTFQKYMYDQFKQSPTLANPDFIDKHDVFLAKALDIAKIAKPTLMDEANPYFSSNITPAINGFISKAANGNAPDVQSFLNQLQNDAVNWSKSQ